MIPAERFSSREHLGQFSNELQTAIVAVRSAFDHISAINVHENAKENSSGVNDYVTLWDKEGQRSIERVLKEKFPNDKILGEESDKLIENPANQDRLWVIDPIDGTANAKAGRHFSFISLGFTQRGESTVGVVLDPYHNELFYAEKGKGAFCNGRQIHVSSSDEPERANINTDMGFINEVSDLHGDMLKMYGSPSRRMMGSAIGGMIEVACGKADLFFYTTIKPWDNAAVFGILREAGAEIKGINGREIDYTSMDVVAGNLKLVADFVNRVGKPLAEQVKDVQAIFLERNQKLKGVVSGIE